MTMLSKRFLTAALTAMALLAAPVLRAQKAEPRRAISGDMNKIAGPRNMNYQFCVGAGHGGLLLREANQRQLELTHREIGFKYIRFHGILHDDMEAYKEVGGMPVYNWAKIDTVYDAIEHAGMKPFVELSFMPKDLASGKQTIFWWQGNVTPPKDFDKWSAFIEAFVRHLQQRYGDKEVATWYFEVWNEPNLKYFFTGDQQAYFRLYDVTVAAIKKVNPAYRVGGPATAGAGWVPETIAHAQQAGVPLDFVSTHTYGVDGGFLDEKGEDDQKLSTSPEAIVGDMKAVHKQVSDSAMPKLPIHFTEWNTSYSSRDPVHDTYVNAAFVLDKIKNSEGLVDSLSYWTYTDLFEEGGPPPTPFHGGFGLLNREGIRKPTFFAYKYLGKLGPQELVNADRRSWLTRNGGDFSALVWDFTQPKQDKSDRPYYRQLLPAEEKASVVLKITSLTPGKYRLAIHRTGYKANDAYSRYIEWGRPEKITPEQIAELEKLTLDTPEKTQIVTIGGDGVYETKIAMRENDIVFATLTLRK
jgi:xylan 1,4-beta-xylosidase